MTPTMKKTVISLGIGLLIGFSPLRDSGLVKFLIAITGG
jgi:hypothetical protein